MRNDFDTVKQIINDTFDPQCAWMTDRQRTKEFVYYRIMAAWALYYYTSHSAANIGFYLCRKSASDITHMVKRANGYIESDYNYACRIKILMDKMQEHGYEIKNKHGRILVCNRYHGISFPSSFKEKGVPVGKEKKQASYSLVKKPLLKTINTNEMVDFDMMEKKMNTMYSHTQQTKRDAFTHGAYYVEDQIKPSYKLLLDFYNSIPKEFYIKNK